jgi:hypothetical protein
VPLIGRFGTNSAEFFKRLDYNTAAFSKNRRHVGVRLFLNRSIDATVGLPSPGTYAGGHPHEAAVIDFCDWAVDSNEFLPCAGASPCFSGGCDRRRRGGGYKPPLLMRRLQTTATGAAVVEKLRYFRSRSAFEMTETELRLIATAASMGFSVMPQIG